MTDYRPKLKKLRTKSYWKRKAFTHLVNALFLCKHLIDFYLYLNYYFPRRRFTLRRQPRAHYLGYPRQHPHRFAFVMLGAILIFTAIAIPDPYATMHWVLLWGLLFSSWVIVSSASIILQRIRIKRDNQ